VSLQATTTDLEVFRLGLEEHLDRSFLRESARASVFVNEVSRQLVLRLEAAVAGSKRATHEEVVYAPADWWSHLKFSLLLRGGFVEKLVRKLCGPPSMRKLVFSVEGRLVFPDIPVSFRESRRYVRIVETRLKESPARSFV
jgi:hypothetical protein